MFKKPTLTKWWNYNIYIQIFIVISDKLIGTFLDVLFMSVAVILPGLLEKPRSNKD